MNKKQAKVFSPIMLDNGQLEKIGTVLTKITGDEFVLKNELDKDITAGIKIKYDTKVIDLSMKNYLETMKEKIDE